MKYTRIGDIAVVRIPQALAHKEDEIAQALVCTNRGINVVVKIGGRYGEFRKQDVTVLIGDRTDTIHKEYGIRFHLDVKETYFSEREKYERQRLQRLVSDHEDILVLFAGVGVIPLVIAKKKKVTITAVEKNEKAFVFMKENIALNSLKGVITPVLQDVYTFKSKAVDRVIVPQPYMHYSFDVAKTFVREKGFLHYYTWLAVDQDVPAFSGFRITTVKQVSSYAPCVWKVCVDMQKIK